MELSSRNNLRLGSIVILLVLSAAQAVLGGGGVAASSYIGEKQTMDHSAIELALKEIGDSTRTLLLSPGAWKIGQSLVIPSHVNLKLEHGAGLDIAEGSTLTIEGPMDVPGVNQLFYGKGTVRFGEGYIGEVYPQWWGKIEGKDDTAVCQAALDSGARTIRFLKATYAIDAVGDGRERGLGIQPRSNSTVLFDSGAVLQAITTDKNDYTILHITGVENVTIDGATIRGERSTHTGEGGEWGHGLRIVNGSKNVIVKNTLVSDCWGDGIYLGEGTVYDVYVENSTFDNNRRNGCSITNAKNVLFKNCMFSNTNGTSPFKGVDCEPNVAGDLMQNIVFEDCRSFNNTSGGFSIARDDGQDLPVSVTFRGCVSENDGHGFSTHIGPSDCLGIIYINDCTVINPKEVGFEAVSFNLQTKIDGLYIFNPNQKGETRPRHASGVAITNVVPHYKGKTKLTGNIDAQNVHVYSTDGKALYALYMESDLGAKGGFQRLDIDLKTNMPAAKRFYKGRGPFRDYCKVSFSDEPVVAVTQDIGDEEMAQYIGQKITNEGADQEVRLSLNDPRAVSLDSVFTFEVAASYKLTLDFGSAMLLPQASRYLSSAKPGSRLTIRSDGQRWYAVEQIGAWE
jgi:hypothetical protein